MKVLLDTCTFIWLVQIQSSSFPQKAQTCLNQKEIHLNLSVASAWELSIKRSIGKLSFDGTIQDLLIPHLSKDDFSLLPIDLKLFSIMEKLPFHHKDPFDSLIAAQALAQRLPINSPDAVYDAYGVQRIWE